MAMKASDPIMGFARSTAAQAIAYAKNVGAARLDDAIEYINAVYSIAPSVGMDPAVVIAQAVHETGGFSTFADSPWWRNRLNPAGIGITGDASQNNTSKTFQSGTEAARAHIAHLLLYATGKIDKGGLTAADDPRYSAYKEAYGTKAIATTIHGLQNTWGIDNSYAASMVRQGNEVFPSLPNASDVTAPSDSPEPIDDHPPTVDCPVVLKQNSVPISSQHGLPNGAPCEWYEYAVEVGLPPCSHPGTDLAIAYIPCYSPCTATVEFAGNDGYYEPQHVNLRVTEEGTYKGALIIYGHLSAMSVKQGDVVKPGDRIGTTGNAGTGPHLHFELRNAAGNAIDPLPLLRRSLPSTPSTPTPPQEVPMATPVQADYSSLPYPVKVDLIPIGQTNQRPGQKQTVQFINIHETDNTSRGANAAMHNTWLHNGAPGAADTQVSVHFFVDDKQAYQTIPLNEISWNAGCGGSCLGNIAAISIELCVNSDGNYEKARDNVCRLVALLIKQLGLTKAAIKFHQDWSGKWCPRNILDRGLKQDTINKIVGYMDGYSPVPSTPDYAEASPLVVDGVNWDGKNDVTINDILFHGAVGKVTAAVALEARQFADPTATVIRAATKKGDKVAVLGWVESTKVGDENRWWIGTDWARLFVGDTTEKPGDAPEQPEPAPPTVRIENGKRFYPVGSDGKGREVTLARDGNARQWADPTSTVKHALKKGDKVTASYWVESSKAVDGSFIWWVLDDETRLPLLDTVEFPY